jgi:hypothetical protein
MAEDIQIGDPVQIFLNATVWGSEGWFDGTVVRIDPYSEHRSFYWVRLNEGAAALLSRGSGLISVLNPKHIRKVPPGPG